MRRNIRITISIKALTPDFYPTIMVNKNTYSQAQNDPGQTLIYPTYAAANYTFGDNFTAVAQINEFNYTLRDFVNNQNTFFAFSIYSWSYGLTDERKPEFRLSLIAETVNSLLGEEHQEESEKQNLHELHESKEFLN